MPFIEEPDTGFFLGESSAICLYLARSNGWHDLYPQDPKAAAKVDWYLHYHHENVRQASIGYIAPTFRPDIQFPEGTVRGAKAAVERALEGLNTVWLANSKFIAGDSVTFADLAAYTELAQLRPEFTNLYNFEKFANVQRWLNDMMQVDGHDDAYFVLHELGDISSEAPSMKWLGEVNMLAMEHIARKVAGFTE